MPPVHRWFLCSFGAFASCLALAQTATAPAATPAAAPAPPDVDESKIPEWVKRQARSPYKVIIESNAVRGRAATAAAKEEGNGKQAQKKTGAATVAAAAPAPALAPATAALELRGESAVPKAAEPASKAGSVVAVPQAAEPVVEMAATLVSVPPAAPTASATATTSEPTPQGSTAPEPALRVAAATTAEPVPLTLLRRVEPAFPPELIDSKLNNAKVVVAFTVNADGEVVKPSIASTSDPRLNRSVLRAVRDWRYAPIETAREHAVRFEFSMQ